MSNNKKRNKYQEKKQEEQKKNPSKKTFYFIGIAAVASVLVILFIFSNQGKSFFNSLFEKDNTISTPVTKREVKQENLTIKTNNTNTKKNEQILISDTSVDTSNYSSVNETIDVKEELKTPKKTAYITINMKELTRQGKYFSYTTPRNVEIKYFGLLDKAGQAHIAFDACDVCYRSKKGYAIQGDNAVCRNCGNKYPVDAIGTENQYGGCWPSYLPIEVKGDSVQIKIDDIEANEYMFS